MKEHAASSSNPLRASDDIPAVKECESKPHVFTAPSEQVSSCPGELFVEARADFEQPRVNSLASSSACAAAAEPTKDKPYDSVDIELASDISFDSSTFSVKSVTALSVDLCLADQKTKESFTCPICLNIPSRPVNSLSFFLSHL